MRPQQSSLDGDFMLQPYGSGVDLSATSEMHPPSIFSLPPDCLRAATVTARMHSEVLHVISLLLTPQHHLLLIPAIHQHHVRPRKPYQLTGLRLRDAKTVQLTSCNKDDTQRSKIGQNRVLIIHSHTPRSSGSPRCYSRHHRSASI